MNTTLPPPRDLPPHAHARIRAELGRAVTRRRRGWLAPALTGAAALVLAAFFAWPAAPRDVDRTPSGPSSPPTSAASPTLGKRPVPRVSGVAPGRQAQIEDNCAKELDVRRAVLYQLVKDGAGEGALLYSPDGTALDCQMGDPDTPYNPVGGPADPLDWLAGPVSFDAGQASAGGDHSRGIYQGRPGLESFAGRITSDVTRVTVTVSGVAHQAIVANGTYYLRIVHPSDWLIPDPPVSAVLRAYDAHGAVLATVDLATYHPVCLRLPGGKLVPEGAATDPDACRDAVPWR